MSPQSTPRRSLTTTSLGKVRADGVELTYTLNPRNEVNPGNVAALSGTTEKAKLLIEAKADLNAKDATGRTALDLAQRRTDASGKEIAELLQSKGATSSVPIPAAGSAGAVAVPATPPGH